MLWNGVELSVENVRGERPVLSLALDSEKLVSRWNPVDNVT
jgi:hypothetical protein